MLRNHTGIELSALFDGAGMSIGIEMHKTKAGSKALQPFEVIHKAPVVIAGDGQTTFRKNLEMLIKITTAERIIIIGRTVFGDVNVEDYGRSKGMTEVVGPLGFTDLDPEGMLTWGFDQLGTMPTIYNYEYYPKHMEALGGFEVDNKYVEYKLYVPDTVPEKYTKIAKMIQKRYNLHIKKLTRTDIFKNGYGQKIFRLINETYKDLYGFSELTEKQINQYVEMYLPLADLSLITLVEDWNADKKLVGVGITIPSLSRALQKCKRGRMLPMGWWHLLRAIKYHKTNIVDLLLMGVLPEYRSKGANALMFADLIPRYQAYGFEWGESQVEMETNEGVQSQWDALNPVMHKKRKCYIKKIS